MPWNEDRPIGYSEDKVWDPITGMWTLDEDIVKQGSGRYKVLVVIIGHNTVYFGEE